ncbi:MAG: endonuclease V [Isosphaeraceae bacterium]|nr:endonuclease V [Isosphaeraceae bacterium]
MASPLEHDWDLAPSAARALQAELASLVTASALPSCDFVAAADVSHDRGAKNLFAAVVVMERASGRIVESVGVEKPVTFPYVPGLLSFRETPAILAAFRLLKSRVDLLLCDGQGLAHPRGLGVACHVGLMLDLPTFGVAKSRLFGHAAEPGPNRGDRSPLLHDGRLLGTVVRTKPRANPLYLSVGHRCDLETGVDVVMSLTGRRRLPSPAIAAHEFVNRLRRESRADMDPIESGCDPGRNPQA